ncbi:hypothetical protein HPB47_018434 [Ixodes persulcatus]|uniref:Uncharacterized protein n=1 Tax=Ixodes persulcatus TaxID=34615 RepID=A0AC60QKS2_IXOPE|nr:hypothetical protein HPB47_018434 [Ixodes persulcatus]
MQTTTSDLGAFDECIETVEKDDLGAEKVRGQYCNLHVNVGNDTSVMQKLLPGFRHSHWRVLTRKGRVKTRKEGSVDLPQQETPLGRWFGRLIQPAGLDAPGHTREERGKAVRKGMRPCLASATRPDPVTPHGRLELGLDRDRTVYDTLNYSYVLPFYHGVCFFTGCITLLLSQRYQNQRVSAGEERADTYDASIETNRDCGLVVDASQGSSLEEEAVFAARGSQPFCRCLRLLDIVIYVTEALVEDVV